MPEAREEWKRAGGAAGACAGSLLTNTQPHGNVYTLAGAGHTASRAAPPTTHYTPAPRPATLSHPPKKELEPGGATYAAPHESHVETCGARADAGRSHGDM